MPFEAAYNVAPLLRDEERFLAGVGEAIIVCIQDGKWPLLATYIDPGTESKPVYKRGAYGMAGALQHDRVAIL